MFVVASKVSVERLERMLQPLFLCGPDVGSGFLRPGIFGIAATHEGADFVGDGGDPVSVAYSPRHQRATRGNSRSESCEG